MDSVLSHVSVWRTCWGSPALFAPEHHLLHSVLHCHNLSYSTCIVWHPHHCFFLWGLYLMLHLHPNWCYYQTDIIIAWYATMICTLSILFILMSCSTLCLLPWGWEGDDQDAIMFGIISDSHTYKNVHIVDHMTFSVCTWLTAYHTAALCFILIWWLHADSHCR